jgi:hypothetical protein
MVIALAAIMCLSLCLLASCGDKGDGENKGDGNENVKQYTISLEKQSPFGEVNAEAKKSQDGGTLYEFAVTPKFGYAVKSFKINGTEFQLKDNKFECILQQDITVSVEYQRKTNEELEARRETVLKKMQQITGTQFKYDRDYDYLISQKDTHIYGGAIYQGMPYANNPTLNYDAFIEDFTTGPDANGVYEVKDVLAYDKYIWGNNCADVVYWSWATIANSFDNITFSGYFLEKYDLVHVGDYDVLEEEISKDRPKETIDICKRNGMQKMFEAYAMLMKGDGLMFYHPTGGHVIMAAEVKLARTDDGKIDGERSKLVYYDQNSGYSQKQGINNRTVWSSCAYQGTMTFTQLYTEGYLPITCKELMDESIEIEAETFTDSMTAEQLTKINVLRGFIDFNYYVSKAKLEITDANGNVVYSGIRYRDETKPYRVSMTWFAEKTTPSYANMEIYKPFSIDELAAGSYHCKVDVYLSTGNVHTVRDFDFVN